MVIFPLTFTNSNFNLLPNSRPNQIYVGIFFNLIVKTFTFTHQDKF